MRRRRLLAAAAATLTTPLVAGCSRDDGGGGGGGPYGMAGAGDPDASAEPAGSSGAESDGHRSSGPALGPESYEDSEDS